MSDICAKLLEQETRCTFAKFDADDALALGRILIEIARTEIKKGVAIDIELDAHPLFTHYMEGTSENNSYWIKVKKNVVKKFGHSSLYMGEFYKAQNSSFLEATGLDKNEFQGEGGAFPLIIQGKGRIGCITVSGLAGEDDHALAVTGIERYLGKA